MYSRCKYCHSLHKNDFGDFCSKRCENQHDNSFVESEDAAIEKMEERIAALEKQVMELFQLNSNLRNRLDEIESDMDYENGDNGRNWPDEQNKFRGNPAHDPSCWE